MQARKKLEKFSSNGDRRGCGSDVRHLDVTFRGSRPVPFIRIGNIKFLYSCDAATVSIDAMEPLWKATAEDLTDSQRQFSQTCNTTHNLSIEISIPYASTKRSLRGMQEVHSRCE